ncbi:hypothetical protein BRC68_00045 [Halobacteriales archaeon QH_6_64_20]|jgi:hypothetical protein|nr:MAG: hypothetical protein BRC68_00045 [Halobacteriales archaeon QH_6_64_20]
MADRERDRVERVAADEQANAIEGIETGDSGEAPGEPEREADDRAATGRPMLARVPGGVVAFGAGSLATATLLTLAGGGFVLYSIAAGRFYGYQPYQLYLAAFQFAVATVAQSLGVYFARQRVRWTWVMLGAALGTLTFVALPFSVLALACLGVGKYHFASHTPRSVIAGENV